MPAAIRSSAKHGSMCPTAKIARAIVGEPPDASSTRRLMSAAASKYSHQSAAAKIIAATSAAQPSNVATCPSIAACPASTTTSPSRMITNSPKRSAK